MALGTDLAKAAVGNAAKAVSRVWTQAGESTAFKITTVGGKELAVSMRTAGLTLGTLLAGTGGAELIHEARPNADLTTPEAAKAIADINNLLNADTIPFLMDKVLFKQHVKDTLSKVVAIITDDGKTAVPNIADFYTDLSIDVTDAFSGAKKVVSQLVGENALRIINRSYGRTLKLDEARRLADAFVALSAANTAYEDTAEFRSAVQSQLR